MKKSTLTIASLLISFTLLSIRVLAQPNAGDMVVLGIDGVNDKITFATLVDIPSGTELKITDRGWDNATNAFTTSMTGDGVVTWTTGENIDAGDIFSLVLGGSDNTPATALVNITKNTNLTSQITVSGYSVTNTIVSSGEQALIYRGSDTNPYFIFGLNASGNINLDANYWQTSITLSLVQSTLPNGVGSQNNLTAGLNAVGILTNPSGTSTAEQQFDNVYYNGPVSQGNKATWLTRIANNGNWTGDDTGVGTTSVGTTLGTSAVALPVIFNGISAKKVDNKLTISWQTVSEKNNDHFDVQVSKDGVAFETIATVKSKAANGDSDTPLQYHFTIDLTGGVALSGLLMLSVFSAACWKARKWRASIAVASLLVIASLSCSKGRAEIPTGDEPIYLRLVQVDKDGSKMYTKVIAVSSSDN
ncbi:hypothetical protein ABDK00_009710 [Niabella insulamsoli]|uniref:hypothetical protein n=1 Tax=Niabella insulamsoli TaxID=3144874 RepID=UPI0031FD5EF6